MTTNRFLIMLLLMLSAWPSQAAEPAKPLTVFAAASLKESLDEAARTYEKQTGTPVRISYAASSALARQIEQGAPADVFFSADLEWMDYLQQRRKIDPASRRNLLGNQLALVAPKNSSTQVDLKKPASLSAALGNGRLALGQTRSVPAGKYARASLESLGAWNSVKSKLAESESVRAALMLVARGETPLGVVYVSDAKAEPAVRVVAVFPDDSHPAIVYPVASLRDSRHPQTGAFVRWLSSPAARGIFQRRGFTALP
jgi:molybdate transport system substrate-binding protein